MRVLLQETVESTTKSTPGWFEFSTTFGTLGAAVAAGVAAFFSYRQIRLIRAAEPVPQLRLSGDANLVLELEITNHGGTAKQLNVDYCQCSGPDLIDLIRSPVAIMHKIDVLPRGGSRIYKIGQVRDADHFRHNRQRLTQIMSAEEDPAGFVYAIKCTLTWDEAGAWTRQRATFVLVADTDLYNRSTGARRPSHLQF